MKRQTFNKTAIPSIFLLISLCSAIRAQLFDAAFSPDATVDKLIYILNGEIMRIDSDGTNPFVYYKFDEVPAGETYIISVNHKKYQFSPSTRVLNVLEDLSDVNFTANE